MTGPNRPLTPAEMAAVAEVQKLTREAAKATKAERDRVRDDNEKVDRRVTEAQVRAIVGPPYPPETADEFRDISSHHMRVKGAVYTRGADMIAASDTKDPDEILDLARGVERAAARTEPQGLVEHGAADQLPSIYLTARAKEQEVLGGVMQYPQTLRALRVMDPDKDFSHHGHVARAITSLADRKEAFGPDAVMSELKTMNVRQPVVRSDGTTQLHDWADGACLPGHALMAAEDLRTIRIARETEDIGKWLQQASRGAVDDTGVRLRDSLAGVQDTLQEKMAALPPRLDLTSWDLLNHPKDPAPGLDLGLPTRPERPRQLAPSSGRGATTQARR